MKKKRKPSIIGRIFAAVVAVVLIALSATITFKEKWDDVFDYFGLGTENDETYVAIVDVGSADCALLRSGDRAILIDTGDVGDGGRNVERFLMKRGVKYLDSIYITHTHSDHIGGLIYLIREFRVGKIILPSDIDDESPVDIDYVRSVASSFGTEVVTPLEGMEEQVGDFRLNIIMYDNENADLNDSSLVIKAQCRDKDFLFMGDITSAVEKKFLAKNPNITAHVLKIGHHGSGGATSEELLDTVKPAYAAISCGVKYESVPSADTIKRLTDRNIVVNRTDLDSNIYYYVGEGEIRVETEK